jgi:hypothetical protein
MLALNNSIEVPFQLVDGRAFDGWTRLGSPGIFGLSTCYALC